MPTDIWRVNFNAGSAAERRAKLRRFYHTPDAFAGDLGNLRLANDGTHDFAEVCLANPMAGALNFRTKAEMLASPPTAGPGASCFDEDPEFHGFFIPDGTTWGARTGDVRSLAWRDPNHKGDVNDPVNAGVGWLELLFQGFGTNAAGTGSMDDVVDQTRDGFPYMTDLRGLELQYVARARDWRMKRTSKLFQHYQMRSPYHGAMSSEVINGELSPRYPYVNAIQIADPISDQLQLGQGGFGEPNVVDGVKDTGWRLVRIRLSPLSSFWKMLGGITARNGLDGDPFNTLNYVVETAENMLQNPAGLAYNFFMVGFHPVYDIATMADLVDARRSRGKIQIREVALVQPD
jgi:hypothetical protein